MTDAAPSWLLYLGLPDAQNKRLVLRIPGGGNFPASYDDTPKIKCFYEAKKTSRFCFIVVKIF
jgi:hypothetical protein